MRYAVKMRLIALTFIACSGGAAYLAVGYFKGGIHAPGEGQCLSGFANVVVLDGERLKQAKCFRSHEEISGMLADVLARIRKSEADIKSQHDKLRNDKKLSQKQRAKEVSRLEARWSKISGQYNSEIQHIKEKDSALSKLIQDKMKKVIEAIAKSRGADIVINKVANDFLVVFHSSDDVEITDEVIQRLDEELPNIDLGSLKNG
jgi:Skp family chaperone for outer membrane proteins